MFSEPVIEKKRSLFETLDDDAVQNDIVTTNEGFDDPDDPIRLQLRVPEILPCSFDDTVEFWLKRIEFWGKLKIKYTDPEGKTKNISTSEFEKAMTEPEEIVRVFGKWDMKKKSIKSFEASREFYDNSGKKRKETYFVDIDLDRDLGNAFKGKF